MSVQVFSQYYVFFPYLTDTETMFNCYIMSKMHRRHGT